MVCRRWLRFRHCRSDGNPDWCAPVHGRDVQRTGTNIRKAKGIADRHSGVSLEPWKIAGAMASLVSGAYVVSSNRVGTGRGGTQFGGGGYAYAPHGRLLAMTDASHPVQVFELDPSMASSAQREYPCYVPELE